MFKKLKSKIIAHLFLVSAIFTITLSLMFIGVISKMMYDTQVNKTYNNLESGINGCKTYLSTVMGFVDNVATNKVVMDFSSNGGSYNKIKDLLDGLCTTSTKVDGAMLYTSNGYMVYSAGVGSPPLLEELKEVELINDFFNSNEESLISFRKEAIAKVYNKTYYNKHNGIVSCIRKIISESDEVVGLLVVDILPETLYNARFDFSSFETTSICFFSDESPYLLSNEYDKYINYSNGMTNNKSFYIVKGTIEGTDLIILTPLNHFWNKILLISMIVLSIDILLLTITFFVSKYVSRSVIKPLEKLYNMMNETNIR